MTAWTFNETTRTLFPGASITVLQLMEHGDLQRVLPDWIERLIGAYEATSSVMHYITRCRCAWNDLVHEYDLAVEAEARAIAKAGGLA